MQKESKQPSHNMETNTAKQLSGPISDRQFRKILLTINNPLEKGFNHETLRDILATLSPAYWCMADEMSKSGTHHTHVFIYRKGAMRVKTIQRKFPGVHFDGCLGTCAENRDYIRKEGKYAGTDKAGTSIPGTFEEFGELPDDAQEKSPQLYDIIADIEAGKSTIEIIRDNPKYAFRSNDIDTLRETLEREKQATILRDVTVCYFYGETGTGKTRSIFDSHPAKDICRITSYGTSGNGVRFDAYHGQQVLVLEEYHGQIPIAEMLNYLDIYPIMLPARYSDRAAAYNTVYITSNIPLTNQYVSVQKCQPSVWYAFLRRISTVTEFRAEGIRLEHPEQLVLAQAKFWDIP